MAGCGPCPDGALLPGCREALAARTAIFPLRKDSSHDCCYICGPVGAGRHATWATWPCCCASSRPARSTSSPPPPRSAPSGGLLVLAGTEPVLGPDGVDLTAGTYRPTEVCDQGITDKLGIPAAYLGRLREQATDLYDVNVNGWLDRR